MPKTIVVTGASAGIGRALVIRLASLHHHVIAVARTESELKSLQQLYPDNIKIVVADITKAAERQKIIDAIPKSESGIFLVNNAGIAKPKLIGNITDEDWDTHFLTNAKAPFFLTQSLLPFLKKAKKEDPAGRVLNISTSVAHKPLPGMAMYGASKAALFALTKCFIKELIKDEEIIFASVQPGVVDTNIVKELKETDPKKFPAAATMAGYYQRDVVIQPEEEAKFLSWLLLTIDDKSFFHNDDEWDIYDTSHHSEWKGNIKPLYGPKNANDFKESTLASPAKGYSKNDSSALKKLSVFMGKDSILPKTDSIKLNSSGLKLG